MEQSEPGKGGVFTIGHSNHTLDAFLELLRRYGIQVLVDVRSQPYSRYTPHFNHRELKTALAGEGIGYLFLGKELGGRPDEEQHYDAEGRALYGRMAEAPAFLEGLTRLERGIERYRVALMCGEEDPRGCHRRLLVGRALAERGISVSHIRGDGGVQSEEDLVEEENRKSREQPRLPLFDMPEEKPWTSTRSVSPRERRPRSSEP